MKQCPTCKHVFADETLSYCLADGSPLSSSSGSEATLIIPPPALPASLPTEASYQRPAPSPPARQGVNPVVVYVLIAVLALVVGGGVMAFLRPAATNQTPSSPSPSPSRGESATAVNDAPEMNKQARRETSNLSSPTPSPVETPRPGVTPRPNSVTNSYPEPANRSVGESDIESKSCFELKVKRNEIFARHGYIFKTDDMRDYFSRQSWYRPLYADVSGQLSPGEKRYIQLIKQYESRKGCN
jgi:hypothetical protein